ncbi:MAG: hypothetical protein Q8N88_06125 [Nanoarchaeota archaeon]|nr:hypothetical protein [Nanoarchaeota archaeon]
MTTKIDIFDGTGGNPCDVLVRAVNHLGLFIPDLSYRRFSDSEEFVEELKQRVRRDEGRLNASDIIEKSLNHRAFRNPNRKVILLDEILYDENGIQRGLAGGRENRRIAVVSPQELSPSQFYAICLHEMGHLYDATARDCGTSNNMGRHCLDENCVMYVPAFNQSTRHKMQNNLPMYCDNCKEGLRRKK